MMGSVENKKKYKNIFSYLFTFLAATGLAVPLFNKIFSENKPPHAQITCPQDKGAAPFKLICNGDNSSDPEGKTISYEWIIDGKKISSKSILEISLEIPKFYNLTLRVKDKRGLLAQNNIIVEVFETKKKDIPQLQADSPPKKIGHASLDPLYCNAQRSGVNFELQRCRKSNSDIICNWFIVSTKGEQALSVDINLFESKTYIKGKNWQPVKASRGVCGINSNRYRLECKLQENEPIIAETIFKHIELTEQMIPLVKIGGTLKGKKFSITCSNVPCIISE